nr:RHS repeat-associated core domain-containing protein [Paenibacillus sp. MMS18-CY102]
MSLTVSPRSNRAVSSQLTSDPAQVDAYFDATGCQERDEHSAILQWNYDKQLQSYVPGHGALREYYIYGQDGHRVRKVTEFLGTGGNVESIEDTRYIGHLEICSLYSGAAIDPSRLVLQVESARLGIHDQNIATSMKWTVGNPAGEKLAQVRYSLHDQVGSCVIEVDNEGSILTRESYYPYGSTAWSASAGDALQLKKLRYAGKEKDAYTGFYDYGQRYYAPSSYRWLSPDPAGTIDGLNLYAYVGGNPATYTDPHGLMPKQKKTKFKVSVVPRPSGGMKLQVIGRPKKFSSSALRAIAARPENKGYFTDSSGKKFKKSGLSRNHIQPYLTLAKLPRTVTRGKSLSEMEHYLKKDVSINTFSNKIYKNRFAKLQQKKKLSHSDIERGFHTLILDQYNNPDNLFVGNSSANSSGGSIMKHKQSKLKKTFGTKLLQPGERATMIGDFQTASLDFPSNYSQTQKNEATSQFQKAWGNNPGKYI